MDILEAECNMLRNIALNLHKDSLSTASNNKTSTNSTHVEVQEEEIMHQIKDPMDIEKQHSPHWDVNQDEATNLHVFIK
jgi:hypothetical protein